MRTLNIQDHREFFVKNVMKLCRISFVFLLILTGLSFTGQAWTGDKPNILLIINDQHAGSVMTQMGYPHIKTPAIDRLADEGVTFTRA